MKIVVVLLAASIGLNLLAFLAGDGGLIVMLFELVMLGGLLNGNDGVRRFVRTLALLDILVIATGYLASVAIAGMWPPGAITAIVIARLAMLGYAHRALGRDDVRTWMFRSSFGLSGAE